MSSALDGKYKEISRTDAVGNSNTRQNYNFTLL